MSRRDSDSRLNTSLMNHGRGNGKRLIPGKGDGNCESVKVCNKQMQIETLFCRC
jgi:hypothetical protein